MATGLRLLGRRQLPVLGLFVALIPVWTLLLHGGFCIEGGVVVGFPWTFYDRCYAYAPGGPLGTAEFLWVALLIDVVFWYVLSLAAVVVARRAIRP